ncbi:MAG TPA: VCBS repeat-containing protein, partial [Pyrinomonadaceae bacterium]|nr:VCBS repeat-containing protein [Pyrinomonadaceae bacterium]
MNSGISNINACSTTGPGTVPSGCIFSNPNGGYATVQVIEGGAASATTIDFHNVNIPVTNPGGVRVCKVAGPGIPLGTRFRFEVRGLIVSDAAPTVSGVRFVDVAAGPAAEGGNCEFVRDENEAVTRFANNSNVFIQEIGAIDPIPNLGSGEIRVSRITLNGQLTGFPDPGVVTLPNGGQISLSPNPNLNTRQAVITARSNFQEIEFTNFVFRPTLLRICKIAGKGVLQGTPFTFDVTIQNPDGLFSNQAGGLPATAIPVTVQAGPPKQGGFCAFVQGPFPPTFVNPTIGTFPTGATLTVTERVVGASVLATVTSTTGAPTVNLSNRSATLTLGFANSFNEWTFTNARNTSLNDARFDFDGDGRTDFSVFRPSTGEWWYMQSSDGNDRSFPFGTSTDRIVPADYTGDGVTDIAFFRPSTNQWFILRSENLSFFSVTFGAAGDIPVPADFDGDGEGDLAVFRPSESNWYINRSSGGLTIVRFGTDSDFPVPADYDGDGAADLAVFRPSVGEWWILRSSDGESRAFRFGSSTDKPVPADYTGDGRADIAFYRPSTGEWFVLRSEDNSFYSAPFGESGDIPVPGDYDGDERDDFA